MSECDFDKEFLLVFALLGCFRAPARLFRLLPGLLLDAVEVVVRVDPERVPVEAPSLAVLHLSRCLSEQSLQIAVVRLVLEAQRLRVVQEGGKGPREAPAQRVHGHL